jgi:hypothetical protein
MIYPLSKTMAYLLWIGGTLAFGAMSVFYICVCLTEPVVVRRGGLWMVLAVALFTHAWFYFGRKLVKRYDIDLGPTPLQGDPSKK